MALAVARIDEWKRRSVRWTIVLAVVHTAIVFIVEGEEEEEEGVFNVLVVTFTCGSSMKCQNDECNININIDDDDRHSISNRITTTTVYKNSM